jgi:hypothetical protein
MKFSWSAGGIEVTGENRSNGRKTNPTWTDLRPKLRLSVKGSVTNHLSHGVANRTVDWLQLHSTAALATAHKVLVASKIVTSETRVKKMARELEGNTGNYTRGETVTRGCAWGRSIELQHPYSIQSNTVLLMLLL